MNVNEIIDLLQNQTGMSADAIEALAEYSGIGLFDMNLLTGEIALNRNIAQLTGYEPGDIPHDNNSRERLTFEEDRGMVMAAMGSLIEGNTSRYTIEYRMYRRDGSIVSVRESAIVYERDEDGKPTHIAALTEDLSRLRWAEEKARLLEKENHRLASGINYNDLADENRMLRAANSAAAMIIGGLHQDYEDLLKQALQILSESIFAEKAYIWRNKKKDDAMCCFLRSRWGMDSIAPKQERKDIVTYESIIPGYRDILREGFTVCARPGELSDNLKKLPGLCAEGDVMIASLYLNGEFWGMLAFESRTRERGFTTSEAEIMVVGAQVIASSISRNETFLKLNEARESAMASTRAKGEFLSRMSHEIRTPMNAIIGMTTIARKTEDHDRIRYCLDKVDGSSRQLLSLINDILDMSKIDSGKFEIVCAEFDFGRMIQNVVDVVDVKLDEKQQKLHMEIDEEFSRAMVSDELRLSQVLINLLNNATKFTPDGGDITLRVEKKDMEEGRSKLRVEVRDTGIGISAENQKKLFQSFEQADGSITRVYGGTGLGLAICKKIVNLMGGDIWVESEKGRGACFIFEILVAWGEEIHPELETSEDNIGVNWANRTILLADDIEINREIIIQMLEDTGAEIVLAENGESAVKQFADDPGRFDLILMDVQMPVMDGLSATRAIRSMEDVAWAKDVPILAMTANAFKDDQQACFDAGMNDHISKPVEMDVFFKMLSYYLDR